MYKKIILTLIISSGLLSGCISMPEPIKSPKTNQAESNMIFRSLSYSGNNYRINMKLKAAKAGKPLSVLYFSSLIFADNKNFSPQKEITTAIKTFIGDKAKVSDLNFSIKGSASLLGKIMLPKIFSQIEPDIIFIDYAGFDKNEQETREIFESFLRECLQHKNSPQIIILVSPNVNGIIKQDYIEQIAKYYNVPLLNISNAFLPEITSGRVAKDKFYSENYDFTEYGCKNLSRIITNYLKSTQKGKKDNEYILPVPMYKNTEKYDIKFIDPQIIKTHNDSYCIKNGNEKTFFENKIEYIANSANTPLSFTIDAKNIYLIIPESRQRQDITEIFVNGKKNIEINTNNNSEFEEDIPQIYKIYSSDELEKVDVTIQIKNPIIQQENSENEEQIKEYKPFELWGAAYTTN